MKAVLVSLFLSLLFFILSGVVTYLVLADFNPSVTEEGFRYMPIQNVFNSLIIAFPATILWFIIILKYLKRKL